MNGSTVNPWLALPNGAPSQTLTRQLRAAHESFLSSRDQRGHGRRREVRPIVWDSWRRSLGNGVDPDGAAPPVDLLDDELRAYRDAHPLALVMPVIRKLLVEDAESDQMIVAVTDATGMMMWVEGDPRLRRKAETMHFLPGARWGERHAGTNAPAVALALDHSVQIYGSEHFRREVQPWSCSAAPVHDPITGQLLGALDVTGGDHVATPQMLTLVKAAVAAAELELRWHRMREQSRPETRRRFTDAAARAATLDVMGRDRGRLVLRGKAIELSLRHTELLLVLAEAAALGEGRTADQLTLECHHEAASVTVRAELSRLRRILGEDVLASRPYRLIQPVHSDLARMRRLIERAAPRQALDAYRGPLLPGSTAPRVRELRAAVTDDLREAVLSHGDADDLLRWTQTPEGREDREAWQTLLVRLPPGSGRRDAVAGRLAALAQVIATVSDDNRHQPGR